MDEEFQDNPGPAGQCIEIMACQVCGRIEGIKRCGQCRAIGYCGTEHQKADWKVHKVMCIAAKEAKSVDENNGARGALPPSLILPHR